MLRIVSLVIIIYCSIIVAQAKVRSGELFSKTQQLYGKYEVRMRTAQGNGILSTFFTFENDGWMPNTNNPWREIDIEVLGRYTDRFQTNIITGTAESRTTSEFYPTLSVNPAEAFHTYAIEWTPDSIAFLFDGQKVRKTATGDSKKQVEDCRDIPQSYRFNFWANANSGWVGTFNESILPKFQFVNWIKYYKYSASTKTFTLDWTDNFDTYDSGRWAKATHIIENYTQFAPENILVKDGTLILAMTDLNGKGLTNITIPADNTTESVTHVQKTSISPISVDCRGGQILCSFSSENHHGIQLELVKLNGSIIDKKSIPAKTGFQPVTIGKSGLLPGAYIVRISTNGYISTIPVTVVK